MTAVLRDVRAGAKITLVRARKDVATAKVVLNRVRPRRPERNTGAEVIAQLKRSVS